MISEGNGKLFAYIHHVWNAMSIVLQTIERERDNIATLVLPSSWIKLFRLVLKDCNIAALFSGTFFMRWSQVDPDSLS